MKDTTNLTKEVQYLPFIEKEKKKGDKKKKVAMPWGVPQKEQSPR
jgi:hypothetical protein